MSYTLIDANSIGFSHPLIKDLPYIYADLPNGLDGGYYDMTLGGGECELHECEGSFSALNRPVWRCDCGAFMTQYTAATTYYKPRFCPNCGKAVKR